MRITGFVGQTKINLEIKDFSLSHEICMGIRHGLYGNEDENIPLQTAEALESISKALILLGNAGACNPGGGEMGAIEALSMQIKEGLETIASAIPSEITVNLISDK